MFGDAVAGLRLQAVRSEARPELKCILETLQSWALCGQMASVTENVGSTVAKAKTLNMFSQYFLQV